ncbi:MAG: hypothetical protein K2H59_03090 [Muribaculaceae bacterium]|nr:hypothetical protein [Muribaculaceae bacterium]
MWNPWHGCHKINTFGKGNQPQGRHMGPDGPGGPGRPGGFGGPGRRF